MANQHNSNTDALLSEAADQLLSLSNEGIVEAQASLDRAVALHASARALKSKLMLHCTHTSQTGQTGHTHDLIDFIKFMFSDGTLADCIFSDGTSFILRGCNYYGGSFFINNAYNNASLFFGTSVRSTFEAELASAYLAASEMKSLNRKNVVVVLDNEAAVSVFNASIVDPNPGAVLSMVQHLDCTISGAIVSRIHQLASFFTKILAVYQRAHTGQKDDLAMGNEGADRVARMSHNMPVMISRGDTSMPIVNSPLTVTVTRVHNP